MKKVLILYACYGGGHLSAAKSIKQYIDENFEDVQTNMIDCIKYVNKSFEKLSTAAYREMAKKAPWAWEKVYYKSQDGLLAKVSTDSNKIMAVKVAKLFREYKPDVVISTHPFCSQMTAYLKKKAKTNCILATVMTDYVSHDQWLVGDYFNDYFFVSNEKMKEEMVKSGVEQTKIHVTGIPVSKRFLQEYNKDEIYKNFGLVPNKKTVLFFGGGEYGLGKEKTVAILDTLASYDDIQVVAIAGKNEKLKHAFEEIVQNKHKEETVKVLPFTDKVPELMHIADLVITKPGGLTTSESLVSSLPIIFINPIPGQEEENAELLENEGAAIWIRKSSNPKEVIDSVLLNEKRMNYMKENSMRLARKNSTADICKICLEREEKKND